MAEERKAADLAVLPLQTLAVQLHAACGTARQAYLAAPSAKAWKLKSRGDELARDVAKQVGVSE